MGRWLTFASGAAAGAFLGPTLFGRPWSIDHFFTRIAASHALRHPMLLSTIRVLEPYGIHFHSDRLDDFSLAFQREECERMSRELAMLRTWDRRKLTESRRLSADVLDWTLDDAERGARYLLHEYPVNPSFGIHNHLIEFLITVHQIHGRRDALNFILRVEGLGTALAQVCEQVREQAAAGIVPPLWTLRKLVSEIGELCDTPAEQLALATAFDDALATGRVDAADLRPRLLRAIKGVVMPAYSELASLMAELEAQATPQDGAWKLPDGDAYYAWCLRHHTTTELTADEIHEMGVAEVGRIQEEMRQILREEHLGDDVAAAMDRLNLDPRFLYPDSDAGRAKILEDYQAIIDEIDARLDPLFNIRPPSRVRVERVPELLQASAPGAYYEAPPLDGSRPGVFWANLRSVSEIPRFGMRTLAYHEAIPGHHFQVAIAQSLDGLPFFRRFVDFTAYVEGWALYAERLAAEHGFQDDPYDRLGYLTAQLFRAARLVVDTGIHARRWSREEAISYMKQNAGMPEGDVIVEVERYIVSPGQACSYMVGQLSILELRDLARRALGPRFDLREFHDVILKDGALPLPILERVVDDWIARSVPE